MIITFWYAKIKQTITITILRNQENKFDLKYGNSIPVGANLTDLVFSV